MGNCISDEFERFYLLNPDLALNIATHEHELKKTKKSICENCANIRTKQVLGKHVCIIRKGAFRNTKLYYSCDEHELVIK